MKEQQPTHSVSLKLHLIEVYQIVKESLLHPLTTSYIEVDPKKGVVKVTRGGVERKEK